MNDDSKIIQQLRKGNEDAFEHIFRQYFAKLCIYAQNILKKKEAAEEIVEDLFLHLWENCNELNITTSLQSYLFKSVYNRCLKYLRHLKVEQNYINNQQNIYIETNTDHMVSTDYPVAHLISKELEQTIEKAVFNLPEQCREVFIQQRIHDLSYQEIAEKLQISVNTVKTHMTRAMQKLRAELKEYLPIILVFVITGYICSFFMNIWNCT